MCDKSVLESDGMLESVPDCCRNQQMCDKAFDNYHHALKFVPDCYKTQKMSNKAVNRCFLYFILLLIDIRLMKCVSGLLLKIFLCYLLPQ